VVEVERELMASAKETILWRIRRATRDVPEGERPEDVRVERGYRKEDDASREEIVERFAERAAEYEATVRRVRTDELPGALE
jgi:L-lactate dehydrogenase complex protein LldG